MKKCVGFDIGNHAVHIAVLKGGKVVRGFSERLPEGLVQNGRITSAESMVDCLRELKKKYRIKIKRAAVIVPAGQCYCRSFKVAAMTKKQLLFNLPYDFHDFIGDDKRNYFFDYAIVDVVKDKNGNPTEFDVFAAATKKELVSDYIRIFAKAGFKLATIVPQEVAYINLLRHAGANHRHAILDIGHNTVKLYLFSGDKYEGIRMADYGCNALEAVIAENFGVESNFISSNYLEANFENADNLEGCKQIYADIALEVRKAINFYRFNGGGTLEHIHCCGGGAKNAALMDTLRSNLPVKLTDLAEFFENAKNDVDPTLIAAAAGATY